MDRGTQRWLGKAGLVAVVGLIVLVNAQAQMGDAFTISPEAAQGVYWYIDPAPEGERPSSAAPDDLASSTERLVLLASTPRIETLSPLMLTAEWSGGQTDSIVSYAWDLNGDGAFEKTTTTSSLTHTFSESGTVSLSLRAVQSTGEVSFADPVTVHVINRPPIAAFSLSVDRPTESTPVAFSDRSTDPDGQVDWWYWSFGDGATSTHPNPVHTYERPGTYTVTLLVFDDYGRASAPVSRTIDVAGFPPIASFEVQAVPIVGSPVVFQDTSTDPGAEGRIVHVAWDFDDGTYLAGGPRPDGLYAHKYVRPGEYTVALFVIDQDGLLSTTHRVVRVIGAL